MHYNFRYFCKMHSIISCNSKAMGHYKQDVFVKYYAPHGNSLKKLFLV